MLYICNIGTYFDKNLLIPKEQILNNILIFLFAYKEESCVTETTVACEEIDKIT